MSKFIYSFSIILFGLSLGYLIQILAKRGRIKLPIDIDALRIRLQRIALLLINPVAVVGAIWVVSLNNAALAALPFVGLFALLTGGVLALFENNPWNPGTRLVMKRIPFDRNAQTISPRAGRAGRPAIRTSRACWIASPSYP